MSVEVGSASEGVVTTTIDVCRNFPATPCPQLPREQLFDVISRTLAAHRVVMLEGEPLSGKSECLAELMRRSPKTAIGIFLNPDLGVFHSPSYLQLVVAEQASWILDGTRLPDEPVTEEQYLRLLYRLQRYAKHQRITWLIDGLVMTGGGQEGGALAKLIPFGMHDFNFVVTCETDISNALGLRQDKAKAVLVFPVGLEEATSFFADLGVTDLVVHELRSFSAGNVGQMHKLRAFVRAGLSVDELLTEHKPTLESLFEFEWRLIPESEDIKRMLAYVVFSNKPASIGDIARFANKPAAELRSMVTPCRILSLLEESDILTVESRAQRTFVRSRLASYEATVRAHVITSLLEAPSSREATVHLPSELLAAGRHDELLKQLGPNHFLYLLETERSLHSIRRHAGIGIDAARALKNPTAELTLSLIRSAATGLTFSIGFDYQVEALIKLGAVGQALELASIAPTSEERLHVLSIAVSTLHQNKQTVPTELKEQIRTLTEELSFEDLGELGMEIACHLLPVDFDMATEIVRQVLHGARKRIEGANNEQAIGNLPSAVAGSREGSELGAEKSVELLSNDQARRFADAVAATFEKFSFERIMSFIETIEPANKILVLARWLSQNHNHPQAFQIAEKALDIVLGEVSRTPRLQDLREIAEILPSLANSDERETLAKRIEAQIALLGHQGTSEDYCRLWLLIYRVRFQEEPTPVELSLIDLLAEIEALKEVSVQVTCWVWMLFHLNRFPDVEKLENDVPLISEVASKLSTAIDKLLDGTANHFLVARPAIAALAQTNLDEAVKLVARLNTQSSRDRGNEELVRSLVFGTLDAVSLAAIHNAVLNIEDDEVQSKAVMSLLEVVLRRIGKDSLPPISPSLGKLWTHIRVAPFRFQANILTSRILLREGAAKCDLPEMAKVLNGLWDQILVESVKIEIGYWAASKLASDAPDMARDWLTRTVAYASRIRAPSDTVSSALAATISLAARVMPYLDNTEDSFSRIRSLINEVPSPEIQLYLWTRLGIRLHFGGKHADVNKIFAEHVEPILNQSYTGNELLLDFLVAYAAPLLYLVHPATAIHAISRIGNSIYQDNARTNICTVLFQRCPIGEPFDSRESFEYSVDQATIADVLSLLKDIRTDSSIIGVVEDLCLSIGSAKNRPRVSRTAAINYLETLHGVVSEKLPDQKNIKHMGYLIACNAYILRARYFVSKGNVQRTEWSKLYNEARNIPNVADRVVVTAMVGSCALAAKGSSAIGDWIGDVRADLGQIPSDQDRVDRHDWVARIVGTVDKMACRALVSDALKIIVQLPETDNVVRRQRSLLDLANTLDPKIAQHLIDLNDTDEARQTRLRAERDRQTNFLAIARNPGADEVGKMSDYELAEVCRDNLGRLNAGRISARSLQEFRLFQSRASKMSIRLASPIWHFLVESSLTKRKTDKKAEFALQLFDATCRSAEVVCGLIGKVGLGTTQNETFDIGIIRNGDRELFLEKVRAWAENQGGQLIRISDPYFGAEDVVILKAIASSACNAKFRVLTSKEHVRKAKVLDVAESFENSWREISDDLMPETVIAVVGLGTQGKHPIHDRWIVSNGSGLRLGSSSHSMGGVRTSEVSELCALKAEEVCKEIDVFFVSPPREIHDERVSVAQYSL